MDTSNNITTVDIQQYEQSAGFISPISKLRTSLTTTNIFLHSLIPFYYFHRSYKFNQLYDAHPEISTVNNIKVDNYDNFMPQSMSLIAFKSHNLYHGLSRSGSSHFFFSYSKKINFCTQYGLVSKLEDKIKQNEAFWHANPLQSNFYH